LVVLIGIEFNFTLWDS